MGRACLHLGNKAVTIDCTFDIDGPDDFTAALDRIANEAEEAVRSSCEHVMLSDRAVSDTRCPIPMILATGAVHSHLVRQQLRTFASVNVATGECLDVHHFAVLIGVGATTINAYVAEKAIAERHDRGLLPKLTLPEAVANYRKAVEDGLLKIMSKMGISVIASYRGGTISRRLAFHARLWRNISRRCRRGFRALADRHRIADHRNAPQGL